MIAITRPPAPAFLVDTTSKWFLETQKAIAHYNVPYQTKSFKFKAYNDSKVKDELKKVFVKCAYCESKYDHVYDGDIEHFRPKGQVSEKLPKNPGYYWLANDWDNLLLSCLFCNQRRKHLLYGVTPLKSYGKLDQFPLSDETKRLIHHTASFAQEDAVRLLLNPCKDKPEEHFQYDKNEGVIIPVTDRGKKSIDVYVLQRVVLVKERKKTLLLLFKQMTRVKRELERFNDDQSADQQQILQDELDELKLFTKSESVYAGMCRYFVRQFLSENQLI